MLKNKKQLELVGLLAAGIAAVAMFLLAAIGIWNPYDYKILDRFYQQAVAEGKGPRPAFSPGIVYLSITDGTYDYFQKNILDRGQLARINQALARLHPRAVAYDMIFARPSTPESDWRFARSLAELEAVYLPAGFALSDTPPDTDDLKRVRERLSSKALAIPREKGRGRPYHAVRALTQHEPFARLSQRTGHISVRADPDGVYRHFAMLIQVGKRYLPCLSLAVFLDWANTSLDQVTLEWGKQMVIPVNNPWMDGEVRIPIDEHGQCFIPFVNRMGEDFMEVAVHTLLELAHDPAYQGNLLAAFEGNFVLIADAATGTADLGPTPLQASVSLITLHAAALNGMLNNTFFSKWSFAQVLALIFAIIFLMLVSALFRSSWILYSAGAAILAGIIGLTWYEFIHFRLFPVFSVSLIVLVLFFGLVVGLEISASKERAFIRTVFSRYVPETVVNELLAKPEALALGGEERKVTVLFSDLASFTSISETISPIELVHLLNEYLTEMAGVILKRGGIIDKFQGDAIMAEFGVPLPMADQADQAVLAALEMHQRLAALCAVWCKKGRQTLAHRIGVNTGTMVVGNLGSDQVVDYTVIGDAVNLASRLEGANKRYGTALLISQFTHAELTPGRFQSRILDVIRVKGKKAAVKVYEVYGTSEETLAPADALYYQTYHQAFEAYLSRDFARAQEGLGQALSLRPDDLAASRILARIQTLRPDALPEDWDGSVALNSK